MISKIIFDTSNAIRPFIEGLLSNVFGDSGDVKVEGIENLLGCMKVLMILFLIQCRSTDINLHVISSLLMIKQLK